MGTSKDKVIYEAALQERWDIMEAYSKRNKFKVFSSVTVSGDTALHLAVYSKKEAPLRTLLEIIRLNPGMPKPKDKDTWSITNAYGNTILHEAIIAGNFEAVKLLVQDRNPMDADQLKQLEKENVSGETPLFAAASYGRRTILKYLLDMRCHFDDGKLKDVHRKRRDGSSILHAAIKSQHFVTAQVLLEEDESLPALKDGESMDCLQLLAAMPSAFRSGYKMGLLSRFIYSCGLPDTDDKGEQSCFDKVLKPIRLISRKFLSAWPIAENIWKEKKKHESTKRLAQSLVKILFWRGELIKAGSFTVSVEVASNNNVNVQPNTLVVESSNKNGEELLPRKTIRTQNPLFIATSNGILEIIKEILQISPQAIELVNDIGQTLLHVAVLLRQREIFRLVKNNKILLAKMASKIDNNGYSLLHHAADMSSYRGGNRRGPAFQLQEELIWFKRVEKISPPHHVMYREKQESMTAKELFLKHHKKQLDSAKEWTDKTSQSCSTVAVLVATVVFTAAYTIPGGSNDLGLPIFLNDRFFIAFTILDVVALSSSLTSVVMFLSILTTPFECEKFHQNIPRKLIWGFSLLFLSVMVTMLAFASTLFLIIRFRKRWTAGLMSIAAFLPVTVFAMMQFSLYAEVLKSVKDSWRQIMKSLPYFSSLRRPIRNEKWLILDT